MSSESCPDRALRESERLAARVAARTARRLARLRRRPAAARLGILAPAIGPLLRALEEMRRRMPPGARTRLLHGPDLRGFLAEVENWMAIERAAAAVIPGSARGRRLAVLFDRVSGTEHLVTLIPRGRIDAGFPGRAARLARRRIRAAADDLAATLLGIRLAEGEGPVFTADLEFRADPEQGRPGNRIDLGAVVGPAGPIGLLAPGAGRLRVRAGPRAIVVRRPGGGTTTIPAGRAGAFALLADRAGRSRRRRGAPAFVRRDLVPGSPIVLAPAVVCHPRRLVVTGPLPGAGPRLARALRLALIAWPEAHREILLRTRVVVPVIEPRTVSWSIAARPGVSFINLHGKTTVDLADDLLHETAHHHLHDRQEVEDLLRRGPDTGEVQAFDSPWRRARRPLHGLLHGAFTFTFRAGLFRRILRARAAHPRIVAPLLAGRSPAWIRSEIRREDRMIATAVRDLRRADADGLLTPAGRRLLRSLRRRGGPDGLPATVVLRGRAAGRRRARRRSASRRPAR
jgi:HEXXH motif-containing protein